MKNPWLAWYPGEYINKTRCLSMAQHGAYMLLLWEYYINGPLLANTTDLLNVCQSRSSQDETDVMLVLERFFVCKDGFWHNERADEEIEKRESIRAKRQLVGKQGGLAKASHLLKQNPTQSQSQSHIKPIPPARQETPEGFHAIQYAIHICDELAIPKKGNMETVGEAVEILAKSRKTSLVEAHDYLLAKALAAKDAGDVVNMFWFRDGKYNITKQVARNDNHKTAAQLRNERSAENIRRAFAEVEDADNLSGPIRKGAHGG